MLMLFGQDWVKYIGTCSTWHGSLQKTVLCNSQRLALNPLSTCNENGFASAEEPEMAGPRFLKRSKLWLILHQHKDQACHGDVYSNLLHLPFANCYQHGSIHVTSLRRPKKKVSHLSPAIKHGLLENPRTKRCLLAGKSSN